MSQRKGVPLKRVFPIEQGLFLEFFSEAAADVFYQRCRAVGSRVERIDRVTITVKSPNAES